ncbi:hypothetical protein K505DRAFT_310901 [Melanomma pulvis-pyrius CBS 109.77]|uniref:Ribosomal RNA methyltransferase FtsJ domain-containing protein n=1 Tax=Melanomma pulvis-pyrius CBS 109.77 TaxID=1314802 RepID=A0A6A6X2V6_9PLEO|nr:hypothetical protein K505DRAFT_310901 [Melanomma pulvis-pyrius CBS 109.77]
MPCNEGSSDGDRGFPSDITATPTPNSIVKKYLLRRVDVFRELMDLKLKGWENPKGDNHFKEQRIRADHAHDFGQRIFYEMMCQIGDELQNNSSDLLPLSALGGPPSVLDLCMAPGGFTASVLKRNRYARVCGISLPLSQGGHKIRLPNWQKDSRLQVAFLDVTMLAAEMDVPDIPAEHPDAANFLLDRPFYGEDFDLVFCDGQVLRMHSRAEYREGREAWRLLASQLVLALQRIRVNGKIVALLHKVDAWNTVALLHTLSKFSSLRLFKPVKKHALRSSFYVVADQVQPQSVYALQAVATWKKSWSVATFGSDEEYREYREDFKGLDRVDAVLSDFGPELIRLGRPIWRIQGAALRKSSFIS